MKTAEHTAADKAHQEAQDMRALAYGSLKSLLAACEREAVNEADAAERAYDAAYATWDTQHRKAGK